MTTYKNAHLFYNSDSGQSKKDRQLEPIRVYFEQHGIPLKMTKVPIPGKDIKTAVDQISVEDVDLFVAAGGDGTISLISNKLIGTEIPLAILPLGTGNLMAQELQIPLNLEKALSLITAEQSKTILMDTMILADRFYLLNVSVGVTPKVMKKTQSKEKQRYGIFAYIVHFVQQFLGLKLNRYFVEYDSKNITFRATEVLITNGQSMGVENLKWSDKIAINDGRLDLFIIRATNFMDVIRLVFSIFQKKSEQNNVMKYIQFSDYCRIESQTPIPTQADGDTIGETPIEIRIKPKSLKVIVGENYCN
jgi:YegS/Rv2252/BmrU family lipid kinase